MINSSMNHKNLHGGDDDNKKEPINRYVTIYSGEEGGEARERPAGAVEEEGDGDIPARERLKRHRREVAGRVWVPEMWGQEELLKDWVDSSCAFDASWMNASIILARSALVEAAGRTTPPQQPRRPASAATR
ncbi:unnamed protein product [Cuscuta campestris]|nr:unnamed protein product [Cuscuta campestris]